MAGRPDLFSLTMLVDFGNGAEGAGDLLRDEKVSNNHVEGRVNQKDVQGCWGALGAH